MHCYTVDRNGIRSGIAISRFGIDFNGEKLLLSNALKENAQAASSPFFLGHWLGAKTTVQRCALELNSEGKTAILLPPEPTDTKRALILFSVDKVRVDTGTDFFLEGNQTPVFSKNKHPLLTGNTGTHVCLFLLNESQSMTFQQRGGHFPWLAPVFRIVFHGKSLSFEDLRPQPQIIL